MSFAKKSLASLLIVASLSGCGVKKEAPAKITDLYQEEAPIIIKGSNGKDIRARPYELSDFNNKISIVYITDDGAHAYYFDGKNYKELSEKNNLRRRF